MWDKSYQNEDQETESHLRDTLESSQIHVWPVDTKWYATDHTDNTTLPLSIYYLISGCSDIK